MANIQQIIARKNLRLQILAELYDLYFSGGPEAFSSGRREGLVGTKAQIFTDNERHKAVHYLLGKKLIDVSSVGEDLLAIHITADGIDYYESTYFVYESSSQNQDSLS
ncbi:hypothetical protein [Paenibacillus tepidiphilus]|uniref:hypothetical protein n=1 Tax=Paenibacillus tepidiphilus TaxID=2608683 RepID=UPI00123A10CA|nr:hypothetical protein [Paenibacillus tepidiphilus]